MLLGTNQHSPSEVCQTVKKDLRSKKISLAEAARRVGKSPQNMNNILRGNRRLGQSTAELMHREFGYSIPYLRYGIGFLLQDNDTNKFEATTNTTNAKDINLNSRTRQKAALQILCTIITAIQFACLTKDELIDYAYDMADRLLSRN